jgi:hypothetical protein
VLGLALVVELITGAELIGGAPAAPRQQAALPGGRTMRLLDRGAPPGLSGRIADEMPGAVDAVTTFWGDDWPREIVVVTTGSDTDFAAQTGEPTREWAGVAAVAAADEVDVGRGQASGQRIVFAPGAVGMSAPALRIVLRHELFHYAARGATASDCPRWLTEGVADFVARPATPRTRGAIEPGLPVPGLAAHLPSDAQLDAPGQQGSTAYDQAWWFARFVADVYGPSALRRLYLRACGLGHPDAQTAISDVLHDTLPDILQRWQHWLAQ